MDINIIVQLDPSGKPDLTHRELHVGRETGSQTITWWLFGKLAQGAFLPVNFPWPGFKWDGKGPPNGIFSDASIGHNGRSLSIVDTNDAEGKQDTWPYTLRIFHDGTFYELELPEKTGKHPVIINR